MAFNILVVEDEKEISSVVVKYLEREKLTYSLAQNGFEALDFFSADAFHLVILDVMMPGIDGFEVLSEIRNTSNVPVIMLTAKEQEDDRVRGFDCGADDYVVKPFSPRELMRRIKAILRRSYPDNHNQILEFEPFELDLDRMRLTKNDLEIPLTSTEFQLLKTFLAHKGLVLTREQLIEHAFGHDYDGYDRNIDSYIKRIRQKIEDDPKAPKYLMTKYGAGYVFGGDGV